MKELPTSQQLGEEADKIIREVSNDDRMFWKRNPITQALFILFESGRMEVMEEFEEDGVVEEGRRYELEARLKLIKKLRDELHAFLS